MAVLSVPLRTQVFDLETQIPTSATAAAPYRADLILGAPVITNIYFYCDVAAAFTTAYWRITHQGQRIFPGGTGQPVNAGVPGGWISAPRMMIYPVQIQLPQGPSYQITAEFINLSGAVLNVEIQLTCCFVTTDQLLLEMIERLDYMQPVIEK